MSDLHALIRACKDEPDDDAPRLILADWLDEHREANRIVPRAMPASYRQN